MSSHCSRTRAVSVALALGLAACGPQQEAPAPAPTPEPTPETLSVSMSTELDAPAADVWKAVSDFGGVGAFVESIEGVEVEGEGVGSVRTISLAGDAKIVETLTAWDAEAMSYSYSLDESSFPVEGYEATMTVSALEEGRSRVDWQSTFKARGVPDADARKLVTDIYDMGFAGMKKLFPDAEAEEEG